MSAIGCTQHLKWFIPLASTLTFTGCASLEQAGKSFASVLEQTVQVVAQGDSAPAPVVRSPVQGTALEGIFEKNPITDTQNPQTYPRAAITITSVTSGVLQSINLDASKGTLNADDCATFTVKLWKSPTQSQLFENIKFCADAVYEAVDGFELYQIPNWGRREFYKSEKNTGAIRGDGPVPPTYLFPTDARSQNLWMDGTKKSMFFLGAMFRVMGYDWNNLYDKRVWVVSAVYK